MFGIVFHKNYHVAGIGESVGAVQLVALLAVAAPLITALAQFMPKGAAEKANAAAEQVPEIAQQQTAANLQSAAPEGTSRSVMNVTQNEQGETEMKMPGDENDDLITKTAGGKNNLLLLAGGAAAIFLLSKRK